MQNVLAFPGFTGPEENWSRMPHALIEALPIIESLAEIKIVLYVLRHTWGFQEYDRPKHITIDELQHGRKREDGSRYDSGTGLSKPSVIDGVDRAVKHGFLFVEKDDSDKARKERRYRIRMSSDFTSEVKNLDTGGKESIQRTEKDTSERNSKKDSSANDAVASSQSAIPNIVPPLSKDTDSLQGHIAATPQPGLYTPGTVEVHRGKVSIADAGGSMKPARSEFYVVLPELAIGPFKALGKELSKVVAETGGRVSNSGPEGRPVQPPPGAQALKPGALVSYRCRHGWGGGNEAAVIGLVLSVTAHKARIVLDDTKLGALVTVNTTRSTLTARAERYALDDAFERYAAVWHAEHEPKTKAPKPRAPKAPSKPSAYSNSDVFDAIGRTCFEADTPADVDAVGGRIGKIRLKLVDYELKRRKVDNMGDEVCKFLAGTIEGQFFRWYKAECSGCDMPRDPETFMTWWIKGVKCDFKITPKPDNGNGRQPDADSGMRLVTDPDGSMHWRAV
jgi:hypothetical protein